MKNGTSHAQDLELSLPGSGRRLVYDKMLRGNPDAYFATTGEAVRALVSSPTVAYYDSGFVGRLDPRIKVLTDLRDRAVDHLSFGLQRGSEFLGLLNHQLLLMHQSGQLGFLRQKWVRRRRPDRAFGCAAGGAGGAASALGYDNLFLPGIIMLAGAALSAVMAALELVLRKVLKMCQPDIGF